MLQVDLARRPDVEADPRGNVAVVDQRQRVCGGEEVRTDDRGHVRSIEIGPGTPETSKGRSSDR